MHKIFIDNKRNPQNLKYDHPLFEPIMKNTYGTMIFQEQLMRLCQVVGKMELKDVQRIRKNLLKKIKGRSEEFLKNEDTELSGKFIKGCVENGMSEEKAKEWWSNIKGWGSYGFNKSHSDSYTVMTMQCAWLATYYPLEFYAALLTKGAAKDLQGYVSDIRKRGIKVLPVDVNKSQLENTIEKMSDGQEGIRLAIGSVLGVGDSAANKIVSNQPYASLE
jgi:DNA polymerase-3 subunit alpha